MNEARMVVGPRCPKCEWLMEKQHVYTRQIRTSRSKFEKSMTRWQCPNCTLIISAETEYADE